MLLSNKTLSIECYSETSFNFAYYLAMLCIRGTSHGPVSVCLSVCLCLSLSGRGQGHVSNFYIVDLENFATASRR